MWVGELVQEVGIVGELLVLLPFLSSWACNPEKTWSISSNLFTHSVRKPTARVTGVTKLILNYQSSKRTNCLNSFHSKKKKKSHSSVSDHPYINVLHSVLYEEHESQIYLMKTWWYASYLQSYVNSCMRIQIYTNSIKKKILQVCLNISHSAFFV